MKLNIGCGYNRLEGYINIDSNADTPADKIMPAHNLDFADGSIEEIKALQFIEHLGFFKTKYFLTECRRVLQPGGGLLIETPDITKAFEIFLNGDEAQKEAVLGWVYGSETPGMNHLYCFPADLLAKLLKEAGFEIIESADFYFQTARPALRFKAVKKDSQNADLAATLRKCLLSANIPCFENEVIISEQEKVIKSLISAESPDAALEQAVYSAEIAGQYFGLKPSGDGADFGRKAVCDRLIEGNFQGCLMEELGKKAVNGIFTDEDFNSVFDTGLNYLNCLVPVRLRRRRGPAPAQKIKIFSRAAAEDFCLKKWLSGKSKLQKIKYNPVIAFGKTQGDCRK